MFFSRKIQVTFIDDRSGEVMGVTKLKSAALPAAFFAETTMYLGEEPWSVVSAEPMTRAEYVAGRRLVLRLLPIERINIGDILYSLPTICDHLPTSDGPEADGREVVVREDDWRQIELVSESLLPEVEREIEAIRRIYEQARKGVGFQNLHLRSRIQRPIENERLSLEDAQALAGDRPCLSLRFDGFGRRIDGGFGFSFEEGYALYGMLFGQSVSILAMNPAPPQALTVLREFAATNGLLLVDWCRCAVADPAIEESESPEPSVK